MSKIKEWLSSAWETIKDFFKKSTVIFWSRVQTIVGILTVVAGSIDWSAIAQLNWTTPKQTIWIGVGIAANGILTEILRRRTLNVAS